MPHGYYHCHCHVLSALRCCAVAARHSTAPGATVLVPLEAVRCPLELAEVCAALALALALPLILALTPILTPTPTPNPNPNPSPNPNPNPNPTPTPNPNPNPNP